LLAPEGNSLNKQEAAQESINRATNRAVESVAARDRVLGQVQTQQAIAEQGMADIVSNNQTIKLAEDNANLIAQSNTIEGFRAAGGSETQLALMKELKQRGDTVSNLLEERRVDQENAGMLETIVRAALGDLLPDPNKAAIGIALAQQQVTRDRITGLAKATTQVAQTNALTKETYTNATIAANQNLIAARGAIKAAEYKIKNVFSNADIVDKVRGATAIEAELRLKAYQLEESIAAKAAAAEARAFAKKQMARTLAKWKAKDTSDEELEQLKISLVARMHKGQADAGVPIDQLEDGDVLLWGLEQRGSIGDKYKMYLDLGTSPTGQVGETPYETNAAYKLMGGALALQQAPGIKALNAMEQHLADSYSTGKLPPAANEAQVAADFNALAAKLMEDKAKLIVTGDTTNPLHAPSMEILKEHTAVKASPLYQKVLKDFDLDVIDPNDILDKGAAGVVAGTIDIKEAVKGVVSLFTAAIGHNNSMFGGFKKANLPNQMDYVATVLRSPSPWDVAKGLASGLLAITGPLDMLKSPAKKQSELAGIAVEAMSENINVADSTLVMQMLVRKIEALRAQEAATPQDTDTGAK